MHMHATTNGRAAPPASHQLLQQAAAHSSPSAVRVRGELFEHCFLTSIDEQAKKATQLKTFLLLVSKQRIQHTLRIACLLMSFPRELCLY